MHMNHAHTAILLLFSASAAIAATPGVTFEEKGKGYGFEYGYPAVVKQFPELRNEIESDKATKLAELKEWAGSWVTDNPERAKETDLETRIHWQTVTDLPTYLSLTKDEWSYTGGAHGNWGRSSLIWDKKGSKVIAPVAMFISAAAFDKVVQLPFCDLLDVERSKKRDGEKVDRTQTDDWMQACPKPSELTVILGSSNGRRFDRMAVYAGIYSVGPYVEGDYEIDMPITRKLLAAVKPAYRRYFALTSAKTGKRQ